MKLYIANITDVFLLIAICIIIIGSFIFSIKLKFPQFNLKKIFYSIKKLNNVNSFMLSLAGRIGVGSIAGVALLIYIGGPGSVFWMWISCFITVVLTYCETYLGITSKNNKNNIGPFNYIPKYLDVIYALLILITYSICFTCIQSNTIIKTVLFKYNINPLYLSVILGIFLLYIIVGGSNSIIKLTNKLVPFMGILYILSAFVIILFYYWKIPYVLKNIIYSSFNIKSFLSGIIPMIFLGIKRNIFASESGIGTSSIITSSLDNSDAKKVAYCQVLGVYITSLIICSCTAIVILLCNYNSLSISDPNGIEIALYAFNYHLGIPGVAILVICIIMFAFSTILTGYYYGESSLKYLKSSDKILFIFKILFVIIFISSAFMTSTFLWNITDLFMCILLIINVISLIINYKKIK